jgi:hypothetical protein
MVTAALTFFDGPMITAPVLVISVRRSKFWIRTLSLQVPDMLMVIGVCPPALAMVFRSLLIFSPLSQFTVNLLPWAAAVIAQRVSARAITSFFMVCLL